MRQDVRRRKDASDSGSCRGDQSWLGRVKRLLGRDKQGLPLGSDGAACDLSPTPPEHNRPTRKEADMTTDRKQRLRVHIRWMIRRDMPEVLDIERESFEFPWFEEDFIRCLRQRNCIGMVAEFDERVVGFMIYELHKSRLHILNFAVADEFRQRGVGRQMVDKLVGKLSSQRRTRISLEVRETNLPAQLFFKSVGFRATTVLRAYYEDSPEDAYVMQYRYLPEGVDADALPVNRIDRLAG
jgi:[ribosomal protein S18]-alanine N-acetyltransferase